MLNLLQIYHFLKALIIAGIYMLKHFKKKMKFSRKVTLKLMFDIHVRKQIV